MTVQLSVSNRNAQAEAWETEAGTAIIARLFSGAPPTNCAAAATGTKLWEATLAADWAGAALNGGKTLSNLPITAAAVAGAPTNIGHYRFYKSDGTTCFEQGTVTVTGGGGDLTVDNVSIATSQNLSIMGFTKTWGGA